MRISAMIELHELDQLVKAQGLSLEISMSVMILCSLPDLFPYDACCRIDNGINILMQRCTERIKALYERQGIILDILKLSSGKLMVLISYHVIVP